MIRPQMLRLLRPVAILGWFLAMTIGPMPAGTAAAGLGAELYLEHCASCHGENLEGQPDWQSRKADGTLPAPPHDDTGHTWHHGDRLLFDYTKLGGAEAMRRMGATGFQSGMPSFADVLSDDEIRAILDFIKSSWSARERAYQEQVTDQE